MTSTLAVPDTLTRVRGRNGIVRWIGPRPLDPGDHVPAESKCRECGGPTSRSDRPRCMPCAIKARSRPKRRRSGRCDECGKTCHENAKHCAACFERVTEPFQPLLYPGRPICDCGCLLAVAHEKCPNCLTQRKTA